MLVKLSMSLIYRHAGKISFILAHSARLSLDTAPIAAISTANRDYLMEISKVTSLLEKIAPVSLAEEWDNVGLLVEPTSCKVSKIMLTNDLTEPVMAECLQTKCDMILSYHPPIFRPLKRLTQKDAKERIIVKCLENRIAVFSPHTSYDAAQDGVNDWLIGAFGCLNSKSPVNPRDNDSGIGSGRIGTLDSSRTLQEVVDGVKKFTGMNFLRFAIGEKRSLDDKVQTVAVCAGSGASVLRKCTADVFLVGEMSHHEVLAAVSSGTSVILLEHSNSERGFLSHLKRRLVQLFENQVDIVLSLVDKDPITLV